jgi:hypothetical protein
MNFSSEGSPGRVEEEGKGCSSSFFFVVVYRYVNEGRECPQDGGG